MLRGLTERPNVQSTLILSRKDGSIIRATGIDGPDERISSASVKTYQWSQTREAKGGTEGPDRESVSISDKPDESADSQESAKPVEILAATIFQFVNNANALGETLGAVSWNGARADGPFTAGDYSVGMYPSKKERSSEDDAENGSRGDEVQLLRLRTKHQEIIIFPDPNYICCVVQRVGKAGVAHDRR